MKKHAGAARGGEGGALRSCESQSLGIWETSTQYIPCWLIKSYIYALTDQGVSGVSVDAVLFFQDKNLGIPS